MSLMSMARNTVLLAGLGKGVQWLYINRPEMVEDTLERLLPSNMQAITRRLPRRSSRMEQSKNWEEPQELEFSSGSRKPKHRIARTTHAVKSYTKDHPVQSGAAVLLPAAALLVGGWMLSRRGRTA